MTDENEQAQEGVEEQEENTQEEIVETPQEEDTVVLKKSDYTKLNRKAIAYDTNKTRPTVTKTNLDVGDYIDISASLEGLDQREKEYLASQHKMTGKPLAEIRKDEDFNLWQTAYREKAEKEKLSLKPSGTQSESDKPMSFKEKLQSASLEEKEALLTEAGLYKSPRPRVDRVDLGRGK